MGDGRALSDESGAQIAAAGSVVAPGFSHENTNEAFDAANADLEAGRAGTAVQAGVAAIRDEAVRTALRDPLLEQMMAEEREREEAHAEAGAAGAVPQVRKPGLLGRLRGDASHGASGLKGAGGTAGARDARKLGKIRGRK